MLQKLSLVYLILVKTETFSKDKWKLPESVLPVHYQLRVLDIMGEEFKFEGSVQILVKCIEQTSKITLHSRNLVIKEDEVTVRKDDIHDTIVVDGVSSDKNLDFLTINLRESLEVNTNYLVDIEFEGKGKDEAAGFYETIFADKKGALHWIAATYFEPVSARLAFPCFDEPAMKSTFEIIIGRQKNYRSLSNMLIVKSETVEGKPDYYWDYFKVTPIQSTYLVAFVVFDDAMTKLSAGDVNIWVRKDVAHLALPAQEATPKYKIFLENYFGMKYDLPKMDFIGLPKHSQFAVAEEHWGLVTYREDELIFDEPFDISSYNKLNTISHELVHQWFGNLITMKCWSELWLKESFATYFSYIASEHISSGQFYEIYFVVDFLSIMSNYGSRTLGGECKWNYAEFAKVYDDFSYCRGGFIMRMAQIFSGMKDLRTVLHYLLKKHKFSSFNQNDLWVAFKETIPLGVLPKCVSLNTVMDSWTNESGFPLVDVVRNYETDTAVLKQRRFYSNPRKSDENQCWWIPISYASRSEIKNITPRVWMTCPKNTLKLEGLNSSDWLLLNLQLSGLYMVKYDEKNWNLLTDTLKNRERYEDIHFLNRFHLIFDRIMLSLFGHVPHTTLLDTLTYLKHEKKYAPWRAASIYFGKLKVWLEGNSAQFIESYIQIITKALFLKNKLDINRTSMAQMSYQKLIIELSCSFRLPECLQLVNRAFRMFIDAPIEKNPIPSPLRNLVYCNVLSRGIDADFFSLHRKYIESENVLASNERNEMFFSLFCAENKTIIPKLGRILKPLVRAKHPMHKFFEENTPPILKNRILRQEIFSMMEHMNIHIAAKWLPEIANQMHTTKDLNKFKSFTKRNEERFEFYQDVVEESIQTIERNIAWKTKYTKEVEEAVRQILEKLSQDSGSKEKQEGHVKALPMFSSTLCNCFSQSYIFSLMICLYSLLAKRIYIFFR